MEEMQDRISPRRSNSKTNPTSARTFSDILPWSVFEARALQLEDSLDDTDPCCYQPISTLKGTPIRSAADESEIRGPLATMLQSVNNAAEIHGIKAECVGAGSGRSTSYMDLVVRRTGQKSDPDHLSVLVLGAGDVKGNWQFKLERGETLEGMLRDPERFQEFLLAVQQASLSCLFSD